MPAWRANRSTFEDVPCPASLHPSMLIERAQHRECHGLDAGLDSRLRHRRELRRMIGGQFGSGPIPCRSYTFRLVDADVEKHRGHSGIDEFGKVLTGRERRRGSELVTKC